MQAREVKISVLGEGGVGKSASVIQLISHHFVEEYDPTIEDSYRKQVMYDGEPILLDILDTAGCEEYSAMRDQYIRSSQGFLIVYAINRRTSFDQVRQFADTIMRIKDVDSIKGYAVLAGNKLDLGEQREVSTEEARQLADDLGIPFFETSAKTTHNIEQAFGALTGEVLRNLGEDNTNNRNNGRHCVVQ